MHLWQALTGRCFSNGEMPGQPGHNVAWVSKAALHANILCDHIICVLGREHLTYVGHMGASRYALYK